VTGFYPIARRWDRHVSYSTRAVLARFPTFEAGPCRPRKRRREWRKHDAAVKEAEAKLRAAETVREDAWIGWLKAAGEQP